LSFLLVFRQQPVVVLAVSARRVTALLYYYVLEGNAALLHSELQSGEMAEKPEPFSFKTFNFHYQNPKTKFISTYQKNPLLPHFSKYYLA
jgi:hypothetical protein